MSRESECFVITSASERASSQRARSRLGLTVVPLLVARLTLMVLHSSHTYDSKVIRNEGSRKRDIRPGTSFQVWLDLH